MTSSVVQIIVPTLNMYACLMRNSYSYNDIICSPVFHNILLLYVVSNRFLESESYWWPICTSIL